LTLLPREVEPVRGYSRQNRATHLERDVAITISLLDKTTVETDILYSFSIIVYQGRRRGIFFCKDQNTLFLLDQAGNELDKSIPIGFWIDAADILVRGHLFYDGFAHFLGVIVLEKVNYPCVMGAIGMFTTARKDNSTCADNN